MKADPVQIGLLFHHRRRFCVPIYQRQYVWKREKQLEPFWGDVRAKALERINGSSNRYAHYLGAVVLEGAGGFTAKRVPVAHIIDGQQRLTTIQTLLSSLRDVARERGFESLAGDMEKYLLNQEPHLMEEPEVEVFKLWPTKADRQVFSDIILSGNRAKVREKYASYFYKWRDEIRGHSSIPPLLKAYVCFHEWIKTFLTDDPDVGEEIDAQTRLSSLWQALVEDFKVVEIQLEQGDDAQIIFETLNERGEPLLAADLVRNFLFYRIKGSEADRERTYQRYWSPFEQQFWSASEKQGRYKKPRIEFFLANFLASKTENEVKVDKLFSEYRRFIDKSPYPSVEDEFGDLAAYRPLYEALVNPASAPSPLRDFGIKLEPWDISTIFPLALRIALAGISDEEQVRMFGTLLSYIVRRAVCGLTPKGYNKFFLQVLRHLSAHGFSNEELEAYLLKQKSDTGTWPSNYEFQQALVNSPIYYVLTSGRVKTILEEIERAKLNRFNKDITINGGLSVEHIMPVQWFENWPLPDGTTPTAEQKQQAASTPEGDGSVEAQISKRNRIRHTIGNLTLLTQPLNSRVSNGPFEVKKKEITAQSALVLNRELSKAEKWGEEEIADRSHEFYQVAASLWPRPE